jgi:hypothetical protein
MKKQHIVLALALMLFAGNAMAQFVTRSLILRPGGSVNTITLEPAAALAATYSVTLPDVGASTTGPMMRISTSGSTRSVSYSQLNLASNTAITGDVTGVLAVSNGGTGLSTLAQGSLMYGSATNPVNTLAIGTAGQILSVNAGGTAPQWSNVGNLLANATASYTVTAADELAGSATITPAGALGYTATSRLILTYRSTTGPQSVVVTAQGAADFTVQSSGLFTGDIINYIVVNP